MHNLDAFGDKYCDGMPLEPGEEGTEDWDQVDCDDCHGAFDEENELNHRQGGPW